MDDLQKTIVLIGQMYDKEPQFSPGMQKVQAGGPQLAL